MKITSNVLFSLSLCSSISLLLSFIHRVPEAKVYRDQMITHIIYVHGWKVLVVLYYSLLSAAKASKLKGTMFLYQMEHTKILANAYIANICFSLSPSDFLFSSLSWSKTLISKYFYSSVSLLCPLFHSSGGVRFVISWTDNCTLEFIMPTFCSRPSKHAS